MSNAAAPPQPTSGTMPSRSSSSAPKFDGSAQSLKRFLDEVKDLADEKHVTERGAIKAALSYILSDDYPAWSALTQASGTDWAAFVTAVHGIYPGTASTDRQYTKTDLNLLIARTRELPMNDHDDFGRYYRMFFAITSFLLSKGRMGTAEQAEKLVEGLPINLQKELHQYLRAKEPSHHADDPWPLATLYDAIIFVISNLNHAGTMAPHLSDTARARSQVKTEVFDASNLDKYLESDAFFGKISSLMARAQPRTGFTSTTNRFATNTYTNNAGGAAMPMTCSFCSDPAHFLRECPVLQQYLKEGRCGHNEMGKVVLPGNIFVSARTMQGKNIKERIDYWHHVNSPAATANPPASNFLFRIAPQDTTATAPASQEIAELESSIAASHARISALKLESQVSAFGPTTRSRSYGTQDEGQKDVPPHMATTSAPTRNGNAHTSAKEAPAAPAPTIIPAKSTTFPPAPAAVPRTAPQFSYQTPIEDTALVKDVLQRTMDAEVVLTNRELLAVSSDIRKAWRDQTTPKRISNGLIALSEEISSGLMAISNEGEPPISTSIAPITSLYAAIEDRTDGVVVAEHRVDLRAITVNIPGAGGVEAVLDEGCQIVAVSKKVWEKSGLPLRSDHVMSMESANAQRNDTMGLLPDLPITIGGHVFYVQCQVVEDAPYQMLMGRPFLTFTQASVRHFLNGDSHLTLVDPNTQAVITLPTHARDREAEEARFRL